jgi:D-arabinose 1-dehydrogenase-like Zn-dependent alcohol dehydrogenase
VKRHSELTSSRTEAVAKNSSQCDADTQGVLDFSAEHHVDPEIRIIDAESINDAFDDIADNDVAFRYVIDNSTLPASGN